MKNKVKSIKYLLLIWVLISFFLSGCSPDSITAKAVVKTPVIEDSGLADSLSTGLMDTPSVETAKETAEKTEKAPEARLAAPKVEPEIKKIIKEKPQEKVNIVMTVKDEQDIKKISKLIKDSSGEIKGEFKVGGVISAEITAEKLEKISKDDSIEEIATEKEYFAFLNESIPQINIDTIAWANNYTGKGVKIAILDTGIDTTHEMFGNRTILSKSFNSEGVNDLNGHGSHCAGIAAGNGQYKGAAPDAYLLNAKVLTSRGSGKTSNIIAGINWALDPDGNESTDDGADIISMSFGGPLTDLDGPLASAIRDAIDDGVIFVAASGNCRKGCGSFFGVTMPGSMPEVITVGAVNENNNIASFSSGDTFSNYVKPDVVAPGVNIMSATKNGGYKSASGTSMSTPIVAGLIALMLEKESLTHTQIKAKLESTATDLGNSGKDIAYGSGLVNVSGLFGVAINGTFNATNTTINQTESNDNETSNISSNTTTDDNKVDEYEGFFISVPEKGYSEVSKVDIQSTETTENLSAQETNNTQGFIRVKMRQNAVLVKPNETAPLTQSTAQEISEYQTTSSGSGEIDYDDDYWHSTGTTDDGVVWGGEDLDVGLDGEESDTMVICYDWTDDETWDRCFARNRDNFEACWDASSHLYDLCSDNICYTTRDWDDDWDIDTGNSGNREKHYVDILYYRDCDYDDYDYVHVPHEPYYIISPRQYKCTSGRSGGTYYDGGYFTSNKLYVFERDISCGGNWGCDESKDDSNADFGSDGESTPDEPCSLKDGYSDCDGSDDCMSGSHCSCIGWCWGDAYSDYCCPSGEEWINSACRTCDSCSNTGSKKRDGNTIYECKDFGSFTCWDAISDLGDSDFCDYTSCNHNEYDCDSNSECSSGLVCIGSWTGDKGCCYSNEEWDTSSHTCKKKDGQSCSSNSQCYGGYCVHSTCRSSSTYCGDDYCDTGESYESCSADCDPPLGHPDYCDWKGDCAHNEYDCDSNSECGTNLFCMGPTGDWSSNSFDGCCYSNENWDTTAHKCKKKDGESCSSGSQCHGGYCVHGKCRSSNTYCGDNHCDRTLGEDYDNCNADCDPQLGHKDYCDWKGDCSHGEYDCDSDSECASGLVCIGSSWTGDKGCCHSNENWDTTSHKCKAKNGESCTQNANCHSTHCVHDICRPTDPYFGDGYCDSGESCSSSPNDCGKCNGAGCTTGSECQGGYCVHSKCWNSAYKKGDGYCDQGAGESKSNSPNDCFGKLTVLDVTQWPPSVNQGQSFTVKAMLENKGTISQTLNLEAGVVPSSWYSFTLSGLNNSNYSTQAYWGITKCCTGNSYYDAVRITLQPGEMQEVVFNLVAPTIHDIDACDTSTPKKSAWDSSHQLVVGLYSQCGQAYTQYKAKPIHVNDRYCYRDSDCGSNERCDFSSGIPGVCAVAVCENECDTAGTYFCVGTQIRECKDIDNDGCLEGEHEAYCVGEYECVEGQSTCSQKPPKKLRVDYSNGHITVNKQPGDILRLMIDQSGTPSLDYSTSAFELESCYSGTLSTKECKFKVKDKPGTYSIGLRNGPEVTVKITKYPKLIILTDRAKLISRFGDSDEVDSMLLQAYRTAAEKDGVIYDLKDYLTS